VNGELFIFGVVSFRCTWDKEYLTVVKLETSGLLLIKCWTFWYMEHSVRWNLQNRWPKYRDTWEGKLLLFSQ